MNNLKSTLFWFLKYSEFVFLFPYKILAHFNLIKNLTSKICAFSVAFLASCGSVCLAESSGAFIGANYGYGEFRQVTSGGGLSFMGATINASERTTIKTDSFSVGFLMGSKHFFNPYFGFRIFGGIDVYVPEFVSDGQKEDATLVTYGANLDLLVNFIAKEKVDFGIFVGGGVGGNTWLSKEIENIKQDIKANNMGFKVRQSGLDVALNAGLRVHIARRHGIELGTRLPFMPMVLLNENITQAGLNTNIKIEYRHDYNVFGRYTFMF